MTGNNVTLRARDTARRVLWVRLDSPLERPEERTGFRIPNLLATVKSHALAYTWCVLVLLRAWVAAGRPDQNLPTWGSFEEWSHWVRNALVWNGLPDPYDASAARAAVADTESESLEGLLLGLEEVLIATRKSEIATHEVCSALASHEVPALGASQRFRAPRDAIAALRGPDALRSAPFVGALFRKYHGRVVRGRKLEQGPKRSGHLTWRVVVVGQPQASSAGSSPTGGGA